MTPQELIHQTEKIIDRYGTGVLATIDRHGHTHMRWLTPVILPEHPTAIYALSEPSFQKNIDRTLHPEAEWMFQTYALDVIIHLRGRLSILDNPSIKREVIETAFRHNQKVLWKVDFQMSDSIVLATELRTGTFFRSQTNQSHLVSFA